MKRWQRNLLHRVSDLLRDLSEAAEDGADWLSLKAARPMPPTPLRFPSESELKLREAMDAVNRGFAERMALRSQLWIDELWIDGAASGMGWDVARYPYPSVVPYATPDSTPRPVASWVAPTTRLDKR